MCRVRKGSGMARLVFEIEQPPGRLHRPHGVGTKRHALPPLHRGEKATSRQSVRRTRSGQGHSLTQTTINLISGAEEHVFAAAWRNHAEVGASSRWLKSVRAQCQRSSTSDLPGRDPRAEGRARTGDRGSSPRAGPKPRPLFALIEAYRIYLRPVVLGHGKAMLRRPRAQLPPRGRRSDRRGCDPG